MVQDPKEEILGADVVVAQAPRIPHRQVQHVFGSRAVRQVPRPVNPCAGEQPCLRPDVARGDVDREQHLHDRTSAVVDEG